MLVQGDDQAPLAQLRRPLDGHLIPEDGLAAARHADDERDRLLQEPAAHQGIQERHANGRPLGRRWAGGLVAQGGLHPPEDFEALARADAQGVLAGVEVLPRLLTISRVR